HCTDTAVDTNYEDTHGASVVGFAFTGLPGFRILPRLTNIGSIRLYTADPEAEYPSLEPVLTHPIRWDPIDEHNDQMVKYATALRVGMGSLSLCCAGSLEEAQNTPCSALEELGRGSHHLCK
nr:transposase [Actinomycetes bacterium]